MRSKSVDIEGVGTILLVEKPGLRRLSVRVLPNGTIRATFPPHFSAKEALEFVVKNLEWIKKQQLKHEQHREVYQFNQEIDTRHHHISIVPGEKDKLHAGVRDSKVVICIPPSTPIEAEESQSFIRRVIGEVLRREAKKDLPERVERLAQIHGLKYEKVTIKKLKSKWGSCSSYGNLNFNLHVMRLPEHLIDYIVLHELAHIREMNHGPRFWALLDEMTQGRARSLDKEMKKYGALIVE